MLPSQSIGLGTVGALAMALTVALSTTHANAAGEEASMAADVRSRVIARSYPSVFQAWNPADNLPRETQWESVARHDLAWGSAWFFGLAWASYTTGLATGFTDESLTQAAETREDLLRLNPNIVLIAEIRYRDAHPTFLPEGHEWWLRTEAGETTVGWDEGGYHLLDFANPAYRAHVAARAKVAVASGVVDGVLLDWWRDDDDRLALLREVRDAVGPDALIMVNSNDVQVPESAPYVNGLFMEAYRSADQGDWDRIAGTLAWAEANLRQPRVNCLETWFHESRQDLHLMRATTTLTLTTSDGYCLFSDPNPLPTPDHLHDWYAFWEKGLGRPLSSGVHSADGSVRREFEGGTAVYNPMGGRPVTVTFDEARLSRATGVDSTTHTVAAADGDIFLMP
jgi:hypothetical protein